MPEINFFWDPLSDNILQERNETGAVTAEYTAEPGLYGNIISQNRGGVESQFHYDAQGSTVAVTDDNQNVTDTFAYTAFGEVAERTGTTEVPFQYIGRKGYYTDSLSGQIVARRRPYEPGRARWLSADALGPVVTDPDLYSYAQNAPLVECDSNGMGPIFKDPHPFPRKTPLITSSATYVSCQGCGRVSMRWRVAAANTAISTIVQKICFQVNIVECEVFGKCCRGAQRHYCQKCYYEQLFRYSELPVKGIDSWSPPTIPILDASTFPRACGQRGDAKISTEIRAFRFREQGYPMTGWNDGDGKVTCGEFKINASDFSLTEPMWWNEHVAKVNADMHMIWRCCRDDDKISSLAWGSSTGDRGSSPCKDPPDPRPPQ